MVVRKKAKNDEEENIIINIATKISFYSISLGINNLSLRRYEEERTFRLVITQSVKSFDRSETRWSLSTSIESPCGWRGHAES